MSDTIRDLVDGRSGPALGQPGREDLDYRGPPRGDRPGGPAARRRSASAAATGWRSCCRTGRRWRRRSLRSAAARPPRRSTPPTSGDEFEFYLTDLGAKALIVSRAATRRRAPWPRRWACRSSSSAAGGARRATFAPGAACAGPALDGAAATSRSDVALVLHTSGTTSRPKIVPLTQANVAASARQHRARRSRSTPDDRCLNVMPLFHIHGLIAAVLASLARGRRGVSARRASTRCSFFGWLDEVRPTWYTAVPTMHQAILGARAAQRRGDRRARAAALHPLVVGARCRRR